MSKHIEAKTKWPPSCRQHFETHFLEWKYSDFETHFLEREYLDFDKYSIEFCSLGWSSVSIGSDSVWRQTGDKPFIIGTTKPWVYWQIYMLLSLNKLMFNFVPQCYIYVSVNWVSIGLGNGLLPVQHQVSTWNKAVLLSVGPLGTNFNEILIVIQFITRVTFNAEIPSAA